MGASNHRRGRLRRRAATCALVVTVAPLGLARMATNDVEQSWAGEVTVPVAVATQLQALAADDGRLIARLGVDGAALAGQAVDFLLPDGTPLCQAVETDVAGEARCEVGAVAETLPDGRWTAVFRGRGALLAASSSARMPDMTAANPRHDPAVDPDGTADDDADPVVR